MYPAPKTNRTNRTSTGQKWLLKMGNFHRFKFHQPPWFGKGWSQGFHIPNCAVWDPKKRGLGNPPFLVEAPVIRVKNPGKMPQTKTSPKRFVAIFFVWKFCGSFIAIWRLESGGTVLCFLSQWCFSSNQILSTEAGGVYFPPKTTSLPMKLRWMKFEVIGIPTNQLHKKLIGATFFGIIWNMYIKKKTFDLSDVPKKSGKTKNIESFHPFFFCFD